MEIDKNKEFDQMFKDMLHDHEVNPPEHIWSGIQASGLDVAAITSNWKRWAAASVLVLFVTASSYIYFSDDIETSNSENIETPIVVQQQTPENSQQEEASNTIDVVIEKPVEVNKIEQEVTIVDEKTAEELVIEEAIIIEEVNNMIFEEEVTSDEKVLAQEQVELKSSPRTATPESLSSSDASSLLVSKVDANDLDQPKDQQQPSKAGYDFFDDDAINEITKGHLHDKYWTLGLEFSPEWITIPDNDNNIESYGLGLTARYQFSKLFVETGLGFAFSKDNGDYDVDYQEAFFKGSYEDVYNVTFDTTNGAPIPTYYTKTVNIYDTIDRVNVSENKNSYAYLNIPINFGYYTKLGDKFSFYTKLGLNTSFKIYENIPEPTITGTNVTIIKVTPLYHKRTDWHMQAQISAGINYHITDKFLFGLEPNASYYIRSLVEDVNGGNPYGLGVKIGFKYVIK